MFKNPAYFLWRHSIFYSIEGEEKWVEPRDIQKPQLTGVGDALDMMVMNNQMSGMLPICMIICGKLRVPS